VVPVDEIKLQLETVCLVSIFAGLVSVAIPQGKMKGAFTAFCSAVIIFSTVAPVADIRTRGLDIFSFAATEKDELLLNNVSTAETDLYAGLLEAAVEKELEKAGYAAFVKVFCEKQEDEIKVISFTVRGIADENSVDAIRSYLEGGFPGAAVKFEED